MSEAQNTPIITSQSTLGGASLKKHWDGEEGLKSREMIENGNWDYVVLQNHSLSALNDLEAFMEYGKKFGELINESGADPILYLTWSREFDPLMQDSITMAYETLGAEINAKVVPVGPIWREALSFRPDLQLYAADRSHPSPIGAYLTGLVFVKFLTGINCLGLPERLVTTDRDGEKLYISIMDNRNASFLQRVVDNYDLTKETDK